MNPYLTDRDMVEPHRRRRPPRRAGAGRRLREVEQRAAAAALRHRYAELIARRRRGLGAPGHRRPRQGRGRRRHRELRHRQPRRVGAVPQLGDHDARAQPGGRRRCSRSGCSSPTSPARAPGVARPARGRRELALGQARLLPLSVPRTASGGWTPLPGARSPPRRKEALVIVRHHHVGRLGGGDPRVQHADQAVGGGAAGEWATTNARNRGRGDGRRTCRRTCARR